MFLFMETEASSFTFLEKALSTPEDHTQDETNSERGEHRFSRILPHILVSIFPKRSDPILNIIQGLLSLTAILFRDRSRGGFNIFRHLAGVPHAPLCFSFHLRRNRRTPVHLVFLSHNFFLLQDLTSWCCGFADSVDILSSCS